jgi:hypothetical protein
MKNLKNIMTKTMLVAFTIFTISLTTSCSGDDGKDGINGTNGESGTANVIYSNWINQNWNTENGEYYKMMDINEPKITDEIINNGTVLGFWKFSSQSYVVSLPDISNHTSSNYKRDIYFFSGKIRFTMSRFNWDQPMVDLWVSGDATSGVPQYRYVIIPGGTLAGRGVARPDYSKMTYQEICTMFNIPQ